MACEDSTVCSGEELCLLQQQLMAASIHGFENLISTSKNQDLEYLKMTQLALLAVLGNPVVSGGTTT